MRKLKMILMLVFCLMQLFGSAKMTDSLPGIVNRTVSPVRSLIINKSDIIGIRLTCPSSFFPNEPLLVIDGVVYDLKLLQKIDPNDIESINVLREIEASALYGCRGTNGVIIITTKSSLIRKFVVKDFLDGSSIPGATASFISSVERDTLMFVANDSGAISTNKLGQGADYEITVSAVGHKTTKMILKNSYGSTEKDILLERDFKPLDEVVTVAYPVISCRSVTAICTAIPNANSIVKDNGAEIYQSFKLYPNPARQSDFLFIEYLSDRDKTVRLRIIDMSGKLLANFQEKVVEGENKISVMVDPKWSKGIYIVDLTGERNTRINQQKLVIQ